MPRLPSLRRLDVVFLLLALGSSILSVPALAQETTGRLEGRVLDAQGKPIADVNVSVTSPELQGGRGCLTTAQGRFVLLALPVGEYRVKLQHLAYQTQIHEGVHVRLGQTTTLGDVRLADKVIDQPEVQVTAERPLIDPTSTDMGAVLEARDYSTLPVERDYRSVAALLPQANLSFLGDPVNIAGSTGYEIRYMVDGVDVTDPFLSRTATSLPYNFVQEVEVRTGGYEAEYRSALGSTMNAITYSGGNEVKAQAFGYYTKNPPMADQRYAFKPDNGGYAFYDIGAGLGGPILKDRLWYYLAYNPTITREQVEIPPLGPFKDRATTHSFAGKLTWRANARNTLVLSAVGDPTVRDAVTSGWPVIGAPAYAANPDPFLWDMRQGGVGISFEGRHLLRDDLLLRSSGSWATHFERQMPATARGATDLAVYDEGTGTSSGGTGGSTDNRGVVMIAGLTTTWRNDMHEAKAGVEYKETHYDFDWPGYGLTINADGSYDVGDSRAVGRVGTRLPSAFLQDSWRPVEGVRLSLGLRWDGLYIISSDGRVAQSILDQWQPRLGLVWQPDRAGKQKVSAACGRFYHDVALWPLFWYYNANTHWMVIQYAPGHDPRIDPSGAMDTLYFSPGKIQPEIDGLQGQYFDEFTLAYERQVAKGTKVGLRGIYRVLRQGLEDGMNPVTEEWWWGNPGRGELSDFPRARRDYRAIEITCEQRSSERLSFLASYVLSRTWGNYPGLFNSDFNFPVPNGNGSFDMLEETVNSGGVLPNDRTHVLKLSGSYRPGWGLTIGAVGVWESGTPLSEYGSGPWNTPIFLLPRGTSGRTPALWDLGLRVGYEPPLGASGRVHPKLTADFLHIGSQRTPVTYEQLRYRQGDSRTSQRDPNPRYGLPTQFQPPASVRVGFEVQF